MNVQHLLGGAYLSACVFFALLLEADPGGLPATIYAGGKLRVDLSPEQAGFLQDIACLSVTQ